MKFAGNLSVKNMKKRPARTAALVLISAFLSLSIFAGTIVIASLQNGLKSYEERLGADVVVVPYEARTKSMFESILLQGIPGTFYMDGADYDKIAQTDGVETAAPQFYLASASASCCSVSVQIIGFDPELDFTVQPWIREQYQNSLATGDIIVGSELTVPKDHTIRFFGTDCHVVAKLDQTGTGLDTAVYANMDTIRLLIENAKELGFTQFDNLDTERCVSSVMVRVADGFDPQKVTEDINIHVRHIAASQAANMLSGISGGLANVSRIIRLLMVMIWILSIIVLAVAFVMIAHERAKEFAVLRVMGASRGMVSRLILTETAIVSGAGSLLGLVAAAAVLFPFGHLISRKLELPYLLPGIPAILLLAVVSVLLSVLAGAVTSAVTAHRINSRDAAFSMREGA